MLCADCGIRVVGPVRIAREQQGNTPALYVCMPCANKNIGEEKMEANGRVRLNIAKNSKGYGYDFTVEQGSDDLKQAMKDTLRETRAFKMDVQEMINSWEKEDARKPQG